MVTNNKFIVERTNVLAADVTVGTTYAALDDGDFGWYGKAGETYSFSAEVVYDADGSTKAQPFQSQHLQHQQLCSSFQSIH
jgi:hypothetical protein